MDNWSRLVVHRDCGHPAIPYLACAHCHELAPIASRDAPIAHRDRTGSGSGRLSGDSPSVLLAPSPASR